MTDEQRANIMYCGDGVYAEFDGYGLWLRANHHKDSQCTDKVYLEPSVLRRVNEFFERRKKGL